MQHIHTSDALKKVQNVSQLHLPEIILIQTAQ